MGVTRKVTEEALDNTNLCLICLSCKAKSVEVIMAKVNCKFCDKLIDGRRLKTHEKNCSENPLWKDSSEESSSSSEEESSKEETPDYNNMSIEDLMDDITDTEKELADLRQALSKRLDDRGLRFARKEE
jgi:hypothetical protein